MQETKERFGNNSSKLAEETKQSKESDLNTKLAAINPKVSGDQSPGAAFY